MCESNSGIIWNPSVAYSTYSLSFECVHAAICIMAHDFDSQDEREGPLDIFIMALYRVDKAGGG